MLIFDEKSFLRDFYAYVDRHGYNNTETALLCCLERQTIVRLRNREPSRQRGGMGVETVARLAAFADLDIYKYLKELTWTQQEQKKRNGLRNSKQGSELDTPSLVSSASGAQEQAS